MKIWLNFSENWSGKSESWLTVARTVFHLPYIFDASIYDRAGRERERSRENFVYRNANISIVSVMCACYFFRRFGGTFVFFFSSFFFWVSTTYILPFCFTAFARIRVFFLLHILSTLPFVVRFWVPQFSTVRLSTPHTHTHDVYKTRTEETKKKKENILWVSDESTLQLIFSSQPSTYIYMRPGIFKTHVLCAPVCVRECECMRTALVGIIYQIQFNPL